MQTRAVIGADEAQKQLAAEQQAAAAQKDTLQQLQAELVEATASLEASAEQGSQLEKLRLEHANLSQTHETHVAGLLAAHETALAAQATAHSSLQSQHDTATAELAELAAAAAGSSKEVVLAEAQLQQAKNAAAAELSATTAAHAEELAKLREEATQSAAASATEAERAVRAALGNELEQATTAAAADATSNLNAQRERHERELAEAKAQVAAVEAFKAAELDKLRQSFAALEKQNATMYSGSPGTNSYGHREKWPYSPSYIGVIDVAVACEFEDKCSAYLMDLVADTRQQAYVQLCRAAMPLEHPPGECSVYSTVLACGWCWLQG